MNAQQKDKFIEFTGILLSGGALEIVRNEQGQIVDLLPFNESIISVDDNTQSLTWRKKTDKRRKARVAQ